MARGENVWNLLGLGTTLVSSEEDVVEEPMGKVGTRYNLKGGGQVEETSTSGEVGTMIFQSYRSESREVIVLVRGFQAPGSDGVDWVKIG